jgi:hypothetical protein
LTPPSTRSHAFTGWHTGTGGANFFTGWQTGTGGKGLTASHALTGLQTPGVAWAALFHPRTSTANAIVGPIQVNDRLIEALLYKKGGYSKPTGRPEIGRPTSQLPDASAVAHLGLPLSCHYIGRITTSLIVFAMYISQWVPSE